MPFVVQFKGFRRDVPEVIWERHVPSMDGTAALAGAESLTETRHRPMQIDALRVMDDSGRTLLDWTVLSAIPHPSTYAYFPAKVVAVEPRPKPPLRHSYAEDGRPDTWEGGYEIIRFVNPR